MLDLELGRHTEFCALLDFEWLVLQSCFCPFGAEINSHGWTALAVHGQGEDDANARVVRVRNALSSHKAKGFFVPLEGLILGI